MQSNVYIQNYFEKEFLQYMHCTGGNYLVLMVYASVCVYVYIGTHGELLKGNMLCLSIAIVLYRMLILFP